MATDKIRKGRGKCGLGLIEARKQRHQTFKNRKKGLEKKAYELSTLCDVDVAVILLAPEDLDEGGIDLSIWPRDQSVVSKMIKLYQDKQKDDQGGCKTSDMASVYQEKARIVGRQVKKLMKQSVDVKYEAFSYDELSQIDNELGNVLHGLRSRIDSIKACQMFQELSSSGNPGKDSGNYQILQGSNSFNAFGNEGATFVHHSQTMEIKDEGYNHIVPPNLDYFHPSPFGFGQNFEQNNNNITMDQGSLYCGKFYNNVPCNFVYHCPSLPGFGETFEQNNNNLILSQHLSHTQASVFNPGPQYISYTPADLYAPAPSQPSQILGDLHRGIAPSPSQTLALADLHRGMMGPH